MYNPRVLSGVIIGIFISGIKIRFDLIKITFPFTIYLETIEIRFFYMFSVFSMGSLLNYLYDGEKFV